MTMSKKRQQRFEEVRPLIRRILVRHWDPLDVSDTPEASDEYHAYEFRIFERLESDDSVADIARYLRQIERSAMGGPPVDPNADADAAHAAAVELCRIDI